MSQPRVVFFGSPDFSVPLLEAAAEIAEVVGVVTQPDAPAGRGQQLQASPVRRRAEELGLTVMTPEKVSQPDLIDRLRALQPDVCVLAAYGQILPPSVLDVPTKGFINVHPSLLPLYRGSSPIAAPILAGDTVTGVTLIQLDAEMDHGPIIAQSSLAILPDESRSSLEVRLSRLGSELLRSSLLPYLAGKLVPQEQNHTTATYTKRLQRQDALIDWHQPADNIARQVRAYDPWPGTVTMVSGQPLKILAVSQVTKTAKHPPGTVTVDDGQMIVTCGRGCLRLDRVQRAGGRPISGSDFLRGAPESIGRVLG